MKLLFTRNRSPFRPTTRSLRQAAPNGRSGERSISGPSRRARPASKCSGRNLEKSHSTNGLQAVHQIGSVMRSREYLLRETAFGSLDAGASAQPHPHNPRIQQENQAAAGWGERFREGKWRWSQSPANRSLVRLSRFDGNLTGNRLFFCRKCPTWDTTKPRFAPKCQRNSRKPITGIYVRSSRVGRDAGAGLPGIMLPAAGSCAPSIEN